MPFATPSASVPKATSQPAGSNDIEKPTQYVVEVAKIGLVTTGAALVAYLAYRLARRKDDRTNFLAAGAKFREAFAADLAAIEHGNIGYRPLMDYLRTAHDKRHAAAVIAFEPFIVASKLTAFRQAWQRYRYGENENGTPAAATHEEMEHDDLYFLCYAEGRSWETHIDASNTQKAIGRMRQLLSYAAET